jgi:3-oxoacyl-[acyl-carrier-protein] synthase II
MAMLIRGIGLIGAFGTGLAAWEAALRGGWRPPAEVAMAGAASGPRPAYLVDFEAAPDKALLRKLRRADKLSKMAVLAATAALADSGLDEDARGKVGVILATALGPHVTTFEFLDGILDYGDAAASPTAFSHSVHNAAASYVASSLGLQGPTLTVTRFSFAFQEALRLARCWLDQGRCEHVLVGMAEQYGDVLGYIAEAKLGMAAAGRIRPFACGGPGPVPGEGAVFFLLDRDESGAAYCRIGAVQIGSDPLAGGEADLNLVEADGLLPDESDYLAALSSGIPVTGYAPLVGSLMTGSAFNLAAAALMMRRQVLFAAPVPDNPHGLNIVAATRSACLMTVRSIGVDCQGDWAITCLAAP